MASTVSSKLTPGDFNQFFSDNKSNLQKLTNEGNKLKEHLQTSNESFTAAAHLIESFQKEQSTLDIWRKQLKMIQDTSFDEVKQKGDAVHSEFEKSFKESITPLFEKTVSAQLEKVEHAFHAVIEKLSMFRAHRSEENYAFVSEPFENFKSETTVASTLSNRCSIPYNEDQSRSVEMLKKRLHYLEKQTDVYTLSSPVVLAYQFQFVLHRGLLDNHEEWKQTTFNFDQDIEQLPKDLQGVLDHKYYELSPDPKGGKDWAKIHRWDNLGILHDALLRTIREIKEKEVARKVKPDDMDRFYHALHEVAFGPSNIDPVTWSKREFAYLVDLIPAALSKMH